MVIAMCGKGLCGMRLGTKMEMQLHRCREQLSSSSRMNEDKHSLYPVVSFHVLWTDLVVVQLCPTFCNTMDCSTPGFPVHHQLLELAHSCPLSW